MRIEKLKLLGLTVWSLCFAKVVQAATLQEFMGPYDPSLLYWAAITAVMGGIVRTIFSLQGDNIYWGTFFVALWDAGKSLVAGLLAFWVVQALRSSGWLIPNEIRYGAVLAAGILRFTAIFWLRDFGAEWLAARKSQIVSSVKKDAL